ncbi:MAG TPA: cytochrome c biogenesis protein CcsA [Thermoanaerobaculia bacterium]|nr:cytochrome c biogenesis protein CcsA [Thermoanaerobaculia bacterium]
MSPNLTLYLALALYAAGTLVALGSLFGRRLQTPALVLMIAGFVSHTVWIGTICARTHHPPLTNLPETAAFMSWTIFVVELVLLFKYRVQAASFFVYPLVLMLLAVAAVVHEPFVLAGKAQSKLFTTHILLSTIGVAALLIGVAFNALAWMQDRSLKSKQRGRLWEWIPSLNVCRTLSYRALAIGFSIYTLGILTGILWSYRTTAELLDLRVKQVGAIVAWVLFATLLQSYISGVYRGRRTMVISACAVVAVVVAILGIRHV